MGKGVRTSKQYEDSANQHKILKLLLPPPPPPPASASSPSLVIFQSSCSWSRFPDLHTSPSKDLLARLNPKARMHSYILSSEFIIGTGLQAPAVHLPPPRTRTMEGSAGSELRGPHEVATFGLIDLNAARGSRSEAWHFCAWATAGVEREKRIGLLPKRSLGISSPTPVAAARRWNCWCSGRQVDEYLLSPQHFTSIFALHPTQ